NRRIRARPVGQLLPHALGVRAAGTGIGQDLLSESLPAGGFTACGVPGDAAQAGDACEAGVRPMPAFELPRTRVWVLPALFADAHAGADRLPPSAVHPIEFGGLCEQVEGFAGCIELELIIDPVAGDVRSAGVSEQAHSVLIGKVSPVDAIGGLEVRAVLIDPIAD